MRLAVIGSADSWYLRDLERAAAGRHEAVPVPFSRLACQLAGTTFVFFVDGTPLGSFDAVLVRSMPPGSLEQVIFRMDLLARWEAAGVPVVNPPKAVEVAVDKFLASAKLQSAGLRVPRTIICQTADEALRAFELLGGDV